MSASVPSDGIYSPPDGFVESLLTATTHSCYPEPSQAELAQPVDQEAAPAPSTPQTSSDPKTRLRKACDSCSARKVKCDEAGPPCRSCAALDIPCTFERPSRRRGPPNRHADAVKRQRLEPDGSWSATALSPTEDAAHSLASLSATQGLSAESICDMGTLQVLVDYYFTYVYPLTPLPHEPTFRAAFERREDRTNRTFLALLAAMIEALVASFPRRSHQVLSSELHRRLYPSADALIDRCHQVFNDARGIGYLDRELSLYDAFSSYLVGLSAAYTCSTNRAAPYLAECASITQRLALPKLPTDPAMQSHGNGANVGEPDYIHQELSRRLFWLCWSACRSLYQTRDSMKYTAIPFSMVQDPPALPLEIDDAYIHEGRIDPSISDIPSVITGFNLDISVLQERISPSSRGHVDLNDCTDLELQKRLVAGRLHSCKTILDSAPKGLQIRSLTSPPPSMSPALQIGQDGRQQVNWRHRIHQIDGASVLRSSIQNGIQKANIYASQLHARCGLVESYWELFEINEGSSSGLGQQFSASSRNAKAANVAMIQEALKSPTISVPNNGSGRRDSDFSELDLVLERESIVRNLATYLQSVDQIYVCPIRQSFCHKIREVASTLLRSLSKRPSMPTLDLENVITYLTTSLNSISRLENLGIEYVTGEVGSPNKTGYSKGAGESLSLEELETTELAEWVILKDFQTKFTKENGIEQGVM